MGYASDIDIDIWICIQFKILRIITTEKMSAALSLKWSADAIQYFHKAVHSQTSETCDSFLNTRLS